MTNPSVELPRSGRRIQPGDLLTESEARDLVIAQRGERPLMLALVEPRTLGGAFLCRAELPTPANMLNGLLAGTNRPDFTVDELEAAGRAEAEIYITVFVPIGNGQMVARPLVEATPSDFTAYWAWREAMARMN